MIPSEQQLEDDRMPDTASPLDLEDKFVGSLLGGAIGDALGFPAENLSHQRIQARFGRLSDYQIRPRRGYYTDDTQLTIALAETLLACSGFDRASFRRKLARWWLVVPRLSGRSTKNAALKCLAGLERTGANVPGSSAAMRAAPLALFYYADPQALFTATVECATVTHVHPRAIAGALVSVFSIAYCLTHTALDQDAYLGMVAAVAERLDPAFARRLRGLPHLLALPEDRALAELLRHSTKWGSPIDDIIGVSIYAWLKYPDDFAQSMLLCVNAGWDTDTTAAIHGNIAGAWHGRAGIPSRWVEHLENGYKGRDYIIALAQSLYRRRALPLPRPMVLDYGADLWRNWCFLARMLLHKPLW
jgi:ADP-ribosylglycohydrolase